MKLFGALRSFRLDPAIYFNAGESSVRALGRKSARAGLVSIATQGVKFINQLVSLALLARLLTPADFGLVAMGTAVVSVLKMLTGQALAVGVIQSPSLTRRQLNGFFWREAAFCGVLTAAAVGSAPLVARFYGEGRVYWIVAVLSLQIFIGGLSACHLALLQRAMRFGILSALDLIAGVVSKGIAILAAFWGSDYWSLVIMLLLYEGIRGALAWYCTGWIPDRPGWHQESRSLFRFGATLSFQSILSNAAGQLDSILLGKYAGSSQLGFYSRAARLVELPNRMLVWPLENVCISAVSRACARPDKMRRLLLDFAEYTALLLLPVLTILVAAAHDVVVFVLGSQWVSSGPLLQWLAVASIGQVLKYPIEWLLVATDRLKILLVWSMGMNSIARILAIVVGLSWGPKGVAMGIAAASFSLLPVLLWVGLREGPVSRWDYLKGLARPVFSATGALAVLGTVHRLELWASIPEGFSTLAFSVVLTVVVYGLLLLVLPGGREIFVKTRAFLVDEVVARLEKKMSME